MTFCDILSTYATSLFLSHLNWIHFLCFGIGKFAEMTFGNFFLNHAQLQQCILCLYGKYAIFSIYIFYNMVCAHESCRCVHFSYLQKNSFNICENFQSTLFLWALVICENFHAGHAMHFRSQSQWHSWIFFNIYKTIFYTRKRETRDRINQRISKSGTTVDAAILG